MQLINHYTRYSRYEIKGNIHVPLAKRIYYYLLGLLISLWKFAGLFKSIEGSKKQWVLGCKAVYNTSISFVYKTPSDCWSTGFSRITFQPASINVPNKKADYFNINFCCCNRGRTFFSWWLMQSWRISRLQIPKFATYQTKVWIRMKHGIRECLIYR